MPTEILDWSALGGTGTQAADFSGVEHTGTGGYLNVTATLLSSHDYDNDNVADTATVGINHIQGAFDGSQIHTGEVTGGNMWTGSVTGGGIDLNNRLATNTGAGSSPTGESLTTALRLDFDTSNASLYGDGAQNVSFWISDMDTSAWDDFVVVQAYDINGNLVPVSFQNLGSNVTETIAGSRVEAAGSVTSATSPDGAFQVVVAGPVATIIISYGNERSGDQFVRVSDISYETIPPDYPWCFVAGTMIATPNGEVAIETLKAGDLVLTQDNGPQPLRWIGSRSVAAQGEFAPVCFAPGVLGNTTTLKVSGAHRVLVADARVELLFEQSEVLVSAKSLLDGDRVYRAEGGEVTYYHMLFDRHELVWSNGAVSESFHPIDNSLGSVDRGSRVELLALFPELFGNLSQFGPAARPTLSSAEARILVA
ncbi:MAG: Hint domain-containing protein [Paracoccaceae bacterium]